MSPKTNTAMSFNITELSTHYSSVISYSLKPRPHNSHLNPNLSSSYTAEKCFHSIHNFWKIEWTVQHHQRPLKRFIHRNHDNATWKQWEFSFQWPHFDPPLIPLCFLPHKPPPCITVLPAREPPTRRTHSKLLKMICFDPRQAHEQVRSQRVMQQRGTNANKNTQRIEDLHRDKHTRSCMGTPICCISVKRRKTTHLATIQVNILLCMYILISLLGFEVLLFFLYSTVEIYSDCGAILALVPQFPCLDSRLRLP